MPVYIQRETVNHINTYYNNLTPEQRKKKYLNLAERVNREQKDRAVAEQQKLLEEKQKREAEAERDEQFKKLMEQGEKPVPTPTVLDLSGKKAQPTLLNLAAPSMEEIQQQQIAEQGRELEKRDLSNFIDVPENATPEEAAMIMEQQGKHENRLLKNIVQTLKRGAANTAYNLVGQSTFAGPDQEKELNVINKIEKMLPYKSFDWNLFGKEGESIYETLGSNLQTWLNRNALYDNMYASKKFPTYDLPQDEFDATRGSTYVNIPYQANKAIAGVAYELFLAGGLRASARAATNFSLSNYAEKLGEKYFQKLITKGAPKALASFAKFGTKAAVNAPFAGGSLFNYTYTQNVNNLINSEGYSMNDPKLYDLALKRSLVEASLEGIFDQTKFLKGGGEELAGFFGKKAVLKQTAKGIGKEMGASALEEFSQSIATAPFDFDAADKKIAEIEDGIKKGDINPEEGQAMIAQTKMTIGKAIKQATGEGIVGSVTPVILKSIHLPSLTLNNAETQALGSAIQNQDALDEYLAEYVKGGKTLDSYKQRQAEATKIKDFVGQVKNEYDYWATNDAPALYQQAKGRKVMTSSDAMKMGVQVAKLKSISQQLTTSTDEFQTNNLKAQAKLVAQSIKNINNGTDIGQERVTGEEIATMVAKTTPLGNFTNEQASAILEQPAFQQDVLSGARDFNKIVKNDAEVSQYVQDIEQGRLIIDDKVSGSPILDVNNNIIDGKKRFAKAFVEAKRTNNFELAVTKAVEGKALLGIAAASATEIPSNQIVSPFSNNVVLDTLFNGVAENFKIARKEITDNKANKSDSEINDDLEGLVFDTVKELSLSGVKFNDLSAALQRIAGVTPMVAEGNIKYMAKNNMLPNSAEIKKSLKEKAILVVKANKAVGINVDEELNPVVSKEITNIDKEKDAEINAIPTVAKETTVAKEAIKKSRNTKVKKEASILLNDPKAYYESMANQAIQLKLDLEAAGQPTAEADADVQVYTEVANKIKEIEQRADAKKAEVKKKASTPKVKEEVIAEPGSNTAPITPQEGNELINRLNGEIKAIEAQIKTLRQEEVSLGTVEYKPEGKIVGYVGAAGNFEYQVESPYLVDEKGNKKKVKESKAMFPMTAMTKEFIPGTSLYAVEQTKDGYNLIPYNAISSLNSFIDNTAITFDPLYNAAEDIKAKETQTGNFVSVTGAKYSSTKVTPTQPAQFTKVKNKLVLSKKGIAFWGKPYDIKVKINNNQAIQELRLQQDELYKQIDDIRSAEGAAQAEATGRAYKAKLNLMAKEIENNLTNIFDQMGVKRPETLTPKCP